MPHQCTNCSRTFADGSKQMLAGCPDCGGNKFQFLPPGAVDEAAAEAPAAAEPADVEPAGPEPAADRPTPGAAEAVSEEPSAGDSDIIEAPPEPLDAGDGPEDRAQASARRSIVPADELPPIEEREGHDTGEPTSAERPDLAELRRELDEQFESIKILRPGEYELNLMELYDRQEYIIALEEDGRYVIDVPDTWDD